MTSLTRTLNRVKTEKAKEIGQLEQGSTPARQSQIVDPVLMICVHFLDPGNIHNAALVEAEQRRGSKGRSVSDMRSLLARKKKQKVTQGLPNWGEDLPDDVRHGIVGTYGRTVFLILVCCSLVT